MLMLTYLIFFLAIEHIEGSPLSRLLGKDEPISLRSENAHILERYNGIVPVILLTQEEFGLMKQKGTCEDGWIKHNNSCYFFSRVGEIYSWPEALLQCRAIGGYLAEMNTDKENTFVEEQAQLLHVEMGHVVAESECSLQTRTLEPICSCSEECNKSFLTGISKIPDSALTASSSVDADHGPHRSRLNTQGGSGKRGAWSAGYLDLSPWIEFSDCAGLRNKKNANRHYGRVFQHSFDVSKAATFICNKSLQKAT